MKLISERVSILKKEDLLSVVILPLASRKKMFLLFLWLMAWTVCGIIVFANYFRVTDQNARLFIIVYLSFWLYFEFNIARTFIWRRWGKEKLWIQSGLLHYQREVNGKGKIRKFDLASLSAFEKIPLKPTRFSDTVNQSFWVKGGERICFTHLGRIYLAGMQLTEQETDETVKELNKFASRTTASA